MPVQLGANTEHGFDQPLGLMTDCHRRIELFLSILQRVLDQCPGELNGEHRRAVEAGLAYFRVAAPRHTQDEEHSLFPLLRCSGEPRAHRALRLLDALQRDHAAAEAAHAEIDGSFDRWLRDGRLLPDRRSALGRALGELRQLYQEHIAAEEREVFPMAATVLDHAQLARIGREMAARRGVPFEKPQATGQRLGTARFPESQAE